MDTAGNGVPYIMDDVTYKINIAVDRFIESMKSSAQGLHLISISKALNELSFLKMQSVAQERIVNYKAYLEAIANKNEEHVDENDDEELTFFDAQAFLIESENDENEGLIFCRGTTCR